MYLATIILFASIYRIMFTIDTTSFTLPDTVHNGSVFHIYVTFIYFSSTTFTSTGIGDILPFKAWAKLLVDFNNYLQWDIL